MPSALTTGLGYGLGGLAGMGLVLQQIQEDLARQAQTQIAARQGQGTWEPTPAPDRSFFQKLLGGGMPDDVIQLGGGKYAHFKPYPGMTLADVASAGLTEPVQRSTVQDLQLAPPGIAAAPFGSQPALPAAPPTKTIEEPLAAFVGMPKSPQLLHDLAIRRLQEASKIREAQQKQVADRQQQQELLQGYLRMRQQQDQGAPGGAPTVPASGMPMAPPPGVLAAPPTSGARPAPGAPATQGLTGLPGIPPERVPTAQTVVAEAQKQGFDPALALAVAQQESALDPNAKNPQGESRGAGLFGFIPSTGKARGMWEQRYNPQVSAQHGISYLKELIAAHHGDLHAALRAYGGADTPEGNKKYDTEVLDRYETYKQAFAQATPGTAPAPPTTAATPPPTSTSTPEQDAAYRAERPGAAGGAAAPPAAGAPGPGQPTTVPTEGLQPAAFKFVDDLRPRFSSGLVSPEQLAAELTRGKVPVDQQPRVIQELSRERLAVVDRQLKNAEQDTDYWALAATKDPKAKAMELAAKGRVDRLTRERTDIVHALERAQDESVKRAEKEQDAATKRTEREQDKAEALKGTATTEQNAFAVQLYNQGQIPAPDYHGAGNTPAHKQLVNDAIRTYKTGLDRQKAEDKKRLDLELTAEKEQMKPVSDALQGRLFDPEGNPDRSIVTHKDLATARKAGDVLVLSPAEAKEVSTLNTFRSYTSRPLRLLEKVTGPGGVLAGFGTAYGRDPAYWRLRKADIDNDPDVQMLRQALIELKTRGAGILEGLRGRPAASLLLPEIQAGPSLDQDFWGMLTGGVAGKLADLPKTMRAKILRMEDLANDIRQEVLYGSKRPAGKGSSSEGSGAAAREVDAPTASAFMQRARQELFPNKLTGTLTPEEQQAVRERAKVFLHQEGYAP